jgi:magnesium chelatase subunit D
VQALQAGDAFQAAALLLVDPAGLGGVLLRAPAGPVRDAWLSLLQALAPAGMPLPRLPASASEDRLLGGLDLSATLAAGRPVAQAGLLHQADGGIVVAAMAERMPAVNAAHLCAALDTSAVRLERDGLAQRLSARVAVVALDESQGEDSPPSAALADRLGLWVDLTELSVRDVVTADATMAHEVAQARSRLPEVTVPDDIVQALCAATLALGVDSPRAAWAAVRCARAAAALRGATVADGDDAALAARLVLAPRATRQPVVEAPQEDTDPSQEPPSPPPEQDPPAPPDPPDSPDGLDKPPPSEAEEPPAEPDRDPQNAQALEDRLIESAVAAIPAGLLARLASGERVRGRSSEAGRAGAAAASGLHGRPVGSRRGVPRGGQRLHLIDTLRAAAPWQRLRRAQARPDAPPILVRPDDFHLRRHEQKRSTTTIFALDASGSSALYRLAEAKGAIELLLAECYVRRDQVAVLAFRGATAEVILPPTRSLVRAKRGLAGLPGGGGTPLAAGLDAAATLAAQVRRAGGTPVVVLLTDGRANVGRDGQGGRARAQEEALAAARALRAQGGSVIVIDTSVRPEPAALALALAAGARYVALPQADAAALSRAVQGAHGRG